MVHMKYLIDVDCDECISEFAGSGGCNCLTNSTCDVSTLIPVGCISCGDKAIEYCKSEKNKDTLEGE